MSITNTPVKIWRRKEKISSFIGKKGVIESITLVRVAPMGFVQYAPYPVAIIKLSGGIKLIAQITDYHESELKIGQKVVAVIRRGRTEGKKDVIPYVIKFRPL